MTHNTITDFFGPPIHIVTRADLLADGQLVDVSEAAQGVGFCVPVALTAALWHDIRAIPDATPWETTAGRLRAVLRAAVRHALQHPDAHTLLFDAPLATPKNTLPNGVDAPDDRLVTLKLMAGPGDGGEMVLTLLLPEED